MFRIVCCESPAHGRFRFETKVQRISAHGFALLTYILHSRPDRRELFIGCFNSESPTRVNSSVVCYYVASLTRKTVAFKALI